MTKKSWTNYYFWKTIKTKWKLAKTVNFYLCLYTWVTKWQPIKNYNAHLYELRYSIHLHNYSTKVMDLFTGVNFKNDLILSSKGSYIPNHAFHYFFLPVYSFVDMHDCILISDLYQLYTTNYCDFLNPNNSDTL